MKGAMKGMGHTPVKGTDKMKMMSKKSLMAEGLGHKKVRSRTSKG